MRSFKVLGVSIIQVTIELNIYNDAFSHGCLLWVEREIIVGIFTYYVLTQRYKILNLVKNTMNGVEGLNCVNFF